MADHPLKSAIDQSLGRPLPHQQTNQVQAHPMAHKAFSVKTYEVLAQVSSCYSSPKGRYPHVTHTTEAFCRVPSTSFSQAPKYTLLIHLCRFRVRSYDGAISWDFFTANSIH